MCRPHRKNIASSGALTAPRELTRTANLTWSTLFLSSIWGPGTAAHDQSQEKTQSVLPALPRGTSEPRRSRPKRSESPELQFTTNDTRSVPDPRSRGQQLGTKHQHHLESWMSRMSPQSTLTRPHHIFLIKEHFIQFRSLDVCMDIVRHIRS